MVASDQTLVGCGHQRGRLTPENGIFECHRIAQSTSCRFYNGPANRLWINISYKTALEEQEEEEEECEPLPKYTR